MMTMRHFIKKQTIDLAIRSRKDAYRLQQLASEHYWRDIVRVLERVFDEVCREDESIQVDRLEVDLGSITEANIEKGEWADILSARILEKLKLLREVRTKGSGYHQQPAAIGIAGQWFFFLQEGYLPWNAKDVDTVWCDQVLEALASDYEAIEQLRGIISKRIFVSRRIAHQHSVDFIVSLLEAITARSQKELPAHIDELIDIIGHTRKWRKDERMGRSKSFRNEILQKAILLAAERPKQFSPAELFRMIVGAELRGLGRNLFISPRFLTTKRISAHILKELVEKLKQEEVQVEQRELKKRMEELDRSTLEEKNIDNTHAPGVPDEIAHELIEALSEPAGEKDLIDKSMPLDEIYVQHAGLVLLHPFLKSFFHNTGLLENNDFKDNASAEKAVFLLNYLATGRTEAAEHELVIEKLLCGYPLQMPVRYSTELSELELKEADGLLAEVIRHWKILKNTSVNGLREGFLLRNGKLSRKNDDPYLLIERHGIDMLLDDIPWNIRLIQLPWRNDLIRVEW